ASGPVLTAEEQAWLATHRDIRIGISTDWPPFEFIDEQGVYAGLAADYLKIATERLGLTIHLDETFLPWDEVLQRARNEEVDVLPAVAVSEERHGFLRFTRPYIVIPSVIFQRHDAPPIRSMLDLKGKRLACMRGWIVQEQLIREHPEIRLSPNEHVEALLGQVMMGTVDAGIIDLATLSHYSRRHHLSDLTISFRSPYAMHLGMGFRHDWPVMAGLFQKVFDSISKEQATRLYDTWIVPTSGTDELFRTALRWTLVLVVLALFIAAWNLQLRRLVTARTAELEHEMEENRRQAAALAESERKLRALFDQSFQYIGLLATDGRLLQANRSSFDRHALPENHMIGRPFWETSWWSGNPTGQEQLRQAIGRAAAGEFIRFETTHISGIDGLTHYIDFSLKPFEDDAGNVVYLIAEGRDVTEQRQAREARDRMEAQFLQAQKLESVGRLAGGIAHDFNNFLTAINGFAELALHDLSTPPNLRPTLEEIIKAGRSAATLTQQLLAFSRKQVIEPRVIDLNEHLSSMRNMLGRLIGEDILFELNLAPDLGRIRADPNQVEQILVNLAVNAKDAMPHGGTLLVRTANVELKDTGRYIQLEVIDTGTGMTDDVREKLFEPFFTTKPRHEGTGLGLATVYGIVRQNNGRIEVESSPGQGARFRIQFPEASGPLTREKKAAAGGVVSGNGALVLVVEDEPLIRDLIVQGLPVFGFRVTTFATGREALDWLTRTPEKPAALVTDVVMPGMSGRELVDHAHERDPALPVLFTSGYAENVVAHHGVVEEGIQFLMKPYTIQALAVKITEVIAAGRDAPAAPSDAPDRS
ncbi:MAG TPA: transporter substrate-binding domain-containing protein, partial [Candidatus Ozemobacteraceae bacterium]